jgi:lysophospholipid acyltransferase 5
MALFDVPVPAGKNDGSSTASTANGIPQGSLRYATRCFVLGVFYLGLGQVLGSYFPTEALLGKAFLERPYFEKVFIFWWTGKTILNKVPYFTVSMLMPPLTPPFLSVPPHPYTQAKRGL